MPSWSGRCADGIGRSVACSEHLVEAGGPAGRQSDAPHVRHAVTVGVLGQGLGRLQEVLSRPAILGVLHAVLVEELPVVMDGHGAEVLG